ncbi:TPA: sporulation YhaL family protein [Bacillus thuringiensis]|uniref:SigE-dependent sporulation protein n=3 Tax=Bacillus cereus group TaxID=86661 RepID=A0A9X8TD32_BACCE|nr:MULTISPECIES: sporulation YhaL family protein [Bacillus]ANN31273.1 SigE-dependent sporulation protein [Bacillus thuringiensis serovar coreanensis]MDJ0281728.1 sporulation YhaL family protein [Bacillus bombysepticus]QQP80601.1 sporulation YhaL family protein [Bacillus sp. TK-2]HCF51888.1 SigE-dependent sporulation protein [Bacillus sp. (in: firmicutes)]AND06669.1 SigE-dependent sporulation protein [Bacillus thuringiensis serovar alesti]
METLPWWVYLVIVGIVLSGYMVLYTSKKEQDMDNEFIEKEGEVYMKRLEEEREKRNQESDKDSVLL